MKKLFVSILLITMFIPMMVSAAVESYEKLDIKIDLSEGKKVSDVTYQIYASTNENSDLLKDRSEVFSGEISLFRIKDDNSKENLSEVYVLKANERYGFSISNITPNNGVTMNINDVSKVLVNGIVQTNDTMKISIANNVLNIEYSMEKKKETPKEPIEEKEEVVEEKEDKEDKEDNKCLFGLSLCCKEYKGISYCILGIVGVVAIIFIIFIINVIIDKQDDKKYKDF